MILVTKKLRQKYIHVYVLCARICMGGMLCVKAVSHSNTDKKTELTEGGTST